MSVPAPIAAEAVARRHLNPAKLLLSKWTAVALRRKEKHFLVTQLMEPEIPGAAIEWVVLEAVLTRRSRRLPWRELADASRWIQGWH